MWDLNRLKLVRVLTSGDPVEVSCSCLKRVIKADQTKCARINEVSGVVMLCRRRALSLFTLNGDPILDEDVCQEHDDMITACAFYEGSGNEYLERDLIFTGHQRGLLDVVLLQPRTLWTFMLISDVGL